MDLLRFTTAGSVDDGKSTLIGRLLYDSKSIFEDQLEAIERTSVQRGDGYVNLALLTDGLRAEREQGITIDVAYRYFATPRRKFIIADTPGHIQYTRNMVTGASTANLAIVLVDARHGVVEQTRRHAFIASLLQIKHLVLCVNKMDLVDYRQEKFDQIKTEFATFASKLSVPDIHYIPITALHGDNVVDRSTKMPWYEGSTLLYTLENVHIGSDFNMVDSRFPGAVGDPAAVRRVPRLPGLRRPGGRRRVQAGRRSAGLAVGLHHHHQKHRIDGRPGDRSVSAHVGGDDAPGRDRHQPR
jgi:sulfate adenylyltransferase subunit 1